MDVELMIASADGSELLLPAVEEGVEWTTQRRSTPGKLLFKVIKDDKLVFSEGAAVRLTVDGNKVFYGFVFTQKRDKDGIIEVTAYDQLRHLNNKDTYVYENKTASELLQMIASDFELKTGDVEDTGFKIASRVEDNSSLFDMIENALDLTLQNSNEMFVLYDDFGKLALKNISSLFVKKDDGYLLIDEESGENFEYSSSIDSDTYNKIKLGRLFGDSRENKSDRDAAAGDKGYLGYRRYKAERSRGKSDFGRAANSRAWGCKRWLKQKRKLIC